MAAQSLFHFFKLLKEKSIEELDTACALLQISNSAGLNFFNPAELVEL